MSRKDRVTVTVDRELVRVALRSVAEGRADSFSAWVNQALVDRAAKEARLMALAEAIAAYEKEFGAISDAEVAAQQRADRRRARVVRAGTVVRRPAAKPRKRPRGRAA